MSERVHVRTLFLQSHQFSCCETNHFGGNLRRDVRSTNFAPSEATKPSNANALPTKKSKEKWWRSDQSSDSLTLLSTNLACTIEIIVFQLSGQQSSQTGISKSGYLDTSTRTTEVFQLRSRGFHAPRQRVHRKSIPTSTKNSHRQATCP